MSKNTKIKDLIQNTFLFGISSFASRFLSFFLVFIYTKELTTSEYGTMDIVITTVQLLIPILTINIQDAVLRFSLDDEYNPEDVINIGFHVVGWSSLLLGAVVFAFSEMPLISLSYKYWIFLYLSFVTGSINNILSMYLRAKSMIKVLGEWGILNTVITFSANIILLSVMHTGITGYIIAYVSGTLIADAGMFISGHVYDNLKKSRLSRKLLYRMLVFSYPLVANSLGWWVNNASDRFILTFYCGTAINGIYAVSYKIPSILSTVQSIFYNAWSISAIKEFDKNDSDGFIGNVYSAYSITLNLLCSVIMILNIHIAQILYSNDFFVAWKYVPPLLVGAVFNGLGLFNGCIFTAVKRTKEISVTTMLGAIINTVINFILIPFLGAMGASIATMIGYFMIWLIRSVRLKNIIYMNIKWKTQILCMMALLLQSIIACIKDNFLFQIPFLIIILILGRDFVCEIYRKIHKFIIKT